MSSQESVGAAGIGVLLLIVNARGLNLMMLGGRVRSTSTRRRNAGGAQIGTQALFQWNEVERRRGRTGIITPRELALDAIYFYWDQLLAAAQRTACQKDYAQQDVDDVIDFAEHQQRAHIEHVIGASSHKPSHDTEQQVNNSEDDAESACAAKRSRKAEVQRDGA